MNKPYILTLGEEQLEFDKVGDIEEKLKTDDEFHQKVYTYLLTRWESVHIPTSLDEEDDVDGIIKEEESEGEGEGNQYIFD